MPKIKIESAHSPQWANEAHTRIDLMVKFAHLNEEVPFTASIGDSEVHGNELFVRASGGEFGAIADYVAPAPVAPVDISDVDNLNKVLKALALCVAEAAGWTVPQLKSKFKQKYDLL